MEAPPYIAVANSAKNRDWVSRFLAKPVPFFDRNKWGLSLFESVPIIPLLFPDPEIKNLFEELVLCMC